jgi:ribosomal protein S24E
MELQILKENQSLLFPRKEIEGILSANASPSHKDVTVLLSKKFSSPEDTIRVKKIEGKFGSQKFKLSAFVYKSKEDLDKTEVKTKQELEAIKKAKDEAIKTAEEEKKNAQITEETKTETSN